MTTELKRKKKNSEQHEQETKTQSDLNTSYLSALERAKTKLLEAIKRDGMNLYYKRLIEAIDERIKHREAKNK